MRRELTNRPLVLLAVAFAVGLASADPWRLLLAAPLPFFCRSWRVGTSLVLALCIGVALRVPERLDLLDERTPITGVALVRSVPDRLGERQRFVLEVEGRRYVAYAPEDWTIRYGMALDLGREVARPPGPGTEGWMRAWRTAGIVRLESPPRVLDGGPASAVAAAQVRERFLAFTDRSLSPLLSDLLNGLCINADQELDRSVRRDLERTGTIHIVSASGFHVFVLTGALVGLLRRFALPRGIEIALVAATLAFFALVAGLEPPIVRAATMAVVLQAAFLFWREGDALSALSLAAIAFLAFRPSAIYDIGFQLSACAVAGLAIAYRRSPDPISLRDKTLYGVKESLRLGLAATLAISPLLAYHFGRFSLVSMVANPLIAPAVSFAMIGAFAAFPVAALAPGIGGWIVGALVRPFLGWLLLASSALAAIPFAEVEVPEFSAWLLVPVYAGLISLWRWRPIAA